MRELFLAGGVSRFGALIEQGERGGVEGQEHAGAAAVAIGKAHRAKMFLHDLLDDREPQPGAAGARRDIGFDDALTVGGQTDAGIGNFDADLAFGFVKREADGAAGVPARLDRFGRVLDQIGQRLTNLTAIADQVGPGLRAFELEADRRMRDFVQEQCLARNVAQLLIAEGGLRHAREGGELVHHAPKVADLPHDGVGQPAEGGVGGIDPAAISSLQALRGELDRGERVLDFVRDTARDIGPGSAALVELLLGDVIEGQDDAAVSAGDTDGERARFLLPDLDDRFASVVAHEEVELGRHLAKWPPH